MSISFVQRQRALHMAPACLRGIWLAAALLPASLWAQEATDTIPSEAVRLEAISVTATLSPQDVRLAPASGSIISRKELEERNADSLVSAVRGEPGVAFTRGGGIGRKSISLRGMESKHVLTLIDGRRIPASDDVFGHADYQYGWLPMSAVERIEIIRGPMSTLYGSDALGGVINMITRKPGKEWDNSLSLRGATLANSEDDVSSGAASVYASGLVTERLGLRFVGETSSQGKTPNPADTRQSELEGSQAKRGSVAAFLTLTPEQSLEAQYSAGREKRYFDSRAPGVTPVYYENRYALDRSELDLTWRGEFTDWIGQVRAYRSKIDVENWRSAGSNATPPQGLTDEVVDAHASRALGIHWLTVGGELRRETLENTELENGKRKSDHKALFLQDEIELTEELILTAGLRYDYQKPYGSETSPRVYLVWEATPQLIVKGGYGRGFRAPTLKQSSPSYVGVQLPFMFYGNGDIKPEKIDSYELSVDWQLAAVDLSATVFHSEARDLITNRPIDPANQFIQQFVNVDKARFTGLETGLAWRIHSAVIWRNNFGWLRTKDLGTGKELEYRPRTTFNSFIDWQITSGLSARLNMERTGSQYRSGTDGLPAYTLWNASVAKEFGKSFSLRAGVDNIADVHLADKSPNYRHVERGRVVFLSSRINF